MLVTFDGDRFKMLGAKSLSLFKIWNIGDSDVYDIVMMATYSWLQFLDDGGRR